jgi:hypothetical protein
MKTRKFTAAILAASLVTSTFSTAAFAVPPPPPPPVVAHHGTSVVPWLVIGCAGGIILSAFAANARDNRQLTTAEAWSCGTLFWFSQPTTKQVKKHKKKRKKN